MGAEIDRLEIEVEAQATRANNQLDKLVGKLDRVASSLMNIHSGSGLTGLSNDVTKFAQASALLSNVKTTDFNRLIKNIESLTNLNSQQILNTSFAISSMSSSLNGLSGASSGSVQIVELAKAISKLGGSNVQKAITSMPALASAMNDLFATLSKAPTVNQNLVDMTYALAELARQGNKVGTAGKSLKTSVNSVGNSMESNTKKVHGLSSAIGKLYQKYFLVIRGARKLWSSIENSMNYVEVLNYFDATFEQLADSAAQSGTESADSYFEAFSSRAKELTSKMTGFTVNDNGTLTATGNASLGINPTKLMNYQAMFTQMSNSMGVAADTSVKLSQALTELGGDLASVKNMDFDKVWKDMASGLVGMSRTMDKYGVNIRLVNLQEKLFELGIDAQVDKLNQSDKALLRGIIMLERTKYAWGDLADTLNQPANQLRMLNSNFNNLSRTIGGLFLPVVARTLPYINGLVIAVQRLFSWVGSLLGIDLSGITSAVGSAEYDFGELLDDTEALTDGLNDASKAADKLKRGIRAFDELNVISTKDDSASSGVNGGGIASGLLDAAFDKALADYQKVWDEAFANVENRANQFADKIEKYLKPVKDIIEDFAIGDFFKAGQDTSKLISGIFNFFAEAIDRVDWYGIGQDIGDYLAGLNWTEILSSAGHFVWEGLQGALQLWLGSFSEAPIETLTITFGAIAFKYGLKKLTKTVFSGLLANELGWTSIGSKFVFAVSATLAVSWVLKQEIKDEDSFIRKMLDKLAYNDADRKEYQKFNDFSWTKQIQSNFEEVKKGWKGLFDFGENSFSFEKWFNEDVQPWLTKERWQTLGNNAKDGLVIKWTEFTNWWEGTGVYRWWNKVTPWFTKERWQTFGSNMKLGISSKWDEFTAWWESTGMYKWWHDSVEPFFSKDKWTWSGIKDGLTDAWNGAIESIKNLWNKFADWLNDKLTINIDTGSLIGKGISEVLGTSKISLGVIPTFSTGGFPEDGLFMANHGELIGQFSNGKTAVANNQQIVAGIEDAAYRGMMRALSENKGSSNVTFHVEGDPKGIFKVTREEARDFSKRTGKPAFI